MRPVGCEASQVGDQVRGGARLGGVPRLSHPLPGQHEATLSLYRLLRTEVPTAGLLRDVLRTSTAHLAVLRIGLRTPPEQSHPTVVLHLADVQSEGVRLRH